jgi:hypothetical protein
MGAPRSNCGSANGVRPFGAERLCSETEEFNGTYGWRDLDILVRQCSLLNS